MNAEYERLKKKQRIFTLALLGISALQFVLLLFIDSVLIRGLVQFSMVTGFYSIAYSRGAAYAVNMINSELNQAMKAFQQESAIAALYPQSDKPVDPNLPKA